MANLKRVAFGTACLPAGRGFGTPRGVSHCGDSAVGIIRKEAADRSRRSLTIQRKTGRKISLRLLRLFGRFAEKVEPDDKA